MKTEARERLSRYLTELNRLEEKLDGFDALTDALEALQRKTDELYRLNDSEYIPMRRKDYEEIMGLYRRALTACDRYLRSDGAAALPEDAPAKEVRALLEKDIRLLGSLSFQAGEKTLSLPEAVEKARGYTVDLTGVPTESRGGAQSTRVALEVMTESGRSMKGFFTETGEMDPLRQYGAAFKNYYEKLTALKPELLRGGVSALRAANDLAYALGLDIHGRITDDDAIQAMGNTLSLTKRDGRGRTEIDPAAATPELLLALDAARQAEPGLYRELMDALRGVDIQRSLMGRALGLKNGSNIEKRNMGMSIMANLLGRPELVAASVPMTVVRGREVRTGVFMERAEGLEIGSIPFGHPFREKTVRDAVSPAGLESLASLQILDYICMNIDRHRGNLFFRFNEQGQLSGVQGIDNDTSFGVREMRSDRKTAVLAALDDLMVIPESLARTLNGLTKEMLQTGLRGVITDREIDAAWKRVENVQAHIGLGRALEAKDTPGKLYLQSGAIRTVKPEEWARLDPARLCARPPIAGEALPEPEEAQRNRARELDAENRGADRNRPDEFTNLFDIALNLPYKLRFIDRKRYDRLEDEGDPMTPEELLDELGERMAEADSRSLAKKDGFYAQARAVSGLKTVSVSGDAAVIQDFISRLERSGGTFLEGREQYQFMKARLREFPRLNELTRENVSDYRARLGAVKDAARAYLDYKLAKGEPADERTQRRVLAVTQLIEFAEKRETQVSDALEAEKHGAAERRERTVAGALSKARGMTGYIDLIENRVSAFRASAPELSALGETAMAALNGLIDYSASGKPTVERQIQMRRDVAAVMLFEIAVNTRAQNPAGYEAMKNQPGGWESLLQRMTASDRFALMTKNLTPERVEKLASDPSAVRAFAARYAEAQRIREKGAGYRNAALDREHLPEAPKI